MPHACLRALTALWIFVMGPSLFSVNDSNISGVSSSRARPSISCERREGERDLLAMYEKKKTYKESYLAELAKFLMQMIFLSVS